MNKYKAVILTWLQNRESNHEIAWRFFEAETPEAVIALVRGDEFPNAHLIRVFAEEDTEHTTELARDENNFLTPFKS
jgi:hypothetical protein